MKDERNVRHHRAEGARWRPAALLLAAVLIAVSVPFFGKSVFAADPVDVSRNCSLSVDCSGSDVQDKENMVVDLYRVAYLIKDDIYDTYHWAPTSALDGLITLPEDTDREGWKAVTEDLTDLILGNVKNQKQWSPSEVGGLADSFTEYSDPGTEQSGATSYKITGRTLKEEISVPSGFYLIVARGNNIDKYVAKYDSSSIDGSAEESSDYSHMTKTVTLAKSANYTYQFATELIALPTKEEGNNTADPSDWVYDNLQVVLKPSVRGGVGSLEIIKDLDLYEYRTKTTDGKTRDIKDNATFVFEVKAFADENSAETEAPFYQNYVSVNYNDEYGDKKVIIDNIPAGSYVVVTEVYSGRSYTATVDTATTQSVTIHPDETASVTFKNEYDDRHGGGGSFVNNFKYTEKKNNETGWEANRVNDNSTVSEVVKPFNKD